VLGRWDGPAVFQVFNLRRIGLTRTRRVSAFRDGGRALGRRAGAAARLQRGDSDAKGENGPNGRGLITVLSTCQTVRPVFDHLQCPPAVPLR
jgi:hypothetical protein